MRCFFALLTQVVGSSIVNTVTTETLLQEGDFRVEYYSSDKETLKVLLKSSYCNTEFSFPNMVISNSENLLRVIKSQFPKGTFWNRNACVAGSDSKINRDGFMLTNQIDHSQVSCGEKSLVHAAMVAGNSVPQFCAEKYWTNKKNPSVKCSDEVKRICSSALAIRAAMSEFLSAPSILISNSFKLNANVNIGMLLTEDRQFEVSIAGKECVTKLRFMNVADYASDKLMKSLLEKQMFVNSRSGCLNLIYYENDKYGNKVKAVVDHHIQTLARLNCGETLRDTLYEASVNFLGKGGVSVFSPTGNQGIDSLRIEGFCNAALRLRESIISAVAEEIP